MVLRSPNGDVSSSIDIRGWVSLFIRPLTSGKRDQELFESLLQIATKTGHEPYVRELHRKYPKLFNGIAQAVFQTEFRVKYRQILERLEENRTELVSIAKGMAKMLEKEINRPW